MGSVHPPQPPPQQQFPPFNGGVPNFPNPVQNFSQPNAIPHAPSHPQIMPNFHMNQQHLGASNLWNTPNTLFPAGMDKNISQAPQTGNPWQMKPQPMSQQSPQQIR